MPPKTAKSPRQTTKEASPKTAAATPKKSAAELTNPLQFLGIALQIGFTVATTTLLAIYGGWWLDEKYGTNPWGMLLGGFGGFALAMYATWQILSPLRRQLKNFD